MFLQYFTPLLVTVIATPISHINIMRPPGQCFMAPTSYCMFALCVIGEGEVFSTSNCDFEPLIIYHGPGAFIAEIVHNFVRKEQNYCRNSKISKVHYVLYFGCY